MTSTAVDLTTPPDRGVATRLSLLAVVTVLTLELVRASGPLLDRAYTSDGGGAGRALVTALLTYAAAGVLAGAVLLVGAVRGAGRPTGFPSGRVVLLGTGSLAVARLAAQALDGGARVVVGLVATALAVGVLTLVVAFVAGRPDGGHQAALGLTLGVGLATGLQLALGTWDAFWRHDALGWAVTAATTLGAVLLARLVRHEAVGGRPRRLWALGPYLALATLILANPAFAASQDGARLAWAGGVLVLISGGACALLLSPTLVTPRVRAASAVVLPVAVAAALWLHGPWVLVALAVTQVAAATVLATSLGSRRSASPTLLRTPVVATVVGLGTILPLLGYPMDEEVPLGFPHLTVVVVAALVLAGAGLRRRTPAPVGGELSASGGAPSGVATIRPAHVPVAVNPLRLLALPSLLLAVVGIWVCAPGAADAARARGTELRVLDWDLHHGVTPATAVDLEQVARTIEEQDPDVVTLQEVSRGSVVGGGSDMATWLSHRLGMHMVFAPAADRQFGNVILSLSELTDVETLSLPSRSGPEQRSAVSATVITSDGSPVRVTSMHLQPRRESVATRLAQLATVLAEQPSGALVLAGDFNAEPSGPEIKAMSRAGWDSALDTAGGAAGAAALTSPSDLPTRRIDWVFGRGVRLSDAQVLTEPRSSDHLPVVTTVAPAP